MHHLYLQSGISTSSSSTGVHIYVIFVYRMVYVNLLYLQGVTCTSSLFTRRYLYIIFIYRVVHLHHLYLQGGICTSSLSTRRYLYIIFIYKVVYLHHLCLQGGISTSSLSIRRYLSLHHLSTHLFFFFNIFTDKTRKFQGCLRVWSRELQALEHQCKLKNFTIFYRAKKIQHNLLFL